MFLSIVQEISEPPRQLNPDVPDEDLLALWKDADPETPIYIQAQAGYAKLQ